MLFAKLCSLIGFVWKQSHNACALNSNCKWALVLCAHTAHSTWKDLALLCDITSEFLDVFIVDVFDMFYTKLAHFLFWNSLWSTWCLQFFCHISIFSLIKMEGLRRLNTSYIHHQLLQNKLQYNLGLYLMPLMYLLM